MRLKLLAGRRRARLRREGQAAAHYVCLHDALIEEDVQVDSRVARDERQPPVDVADATVRREAGGVEYDRHVNG